MNVCINYTLHKKIWKGFIIMKIIKMVVLVFAMIYMLPVFAGCDSSAKTSDVAKTTVEETTTSEGVRETNISTTTEAAMETTSSTNGTTIKSINDTTKKTETTTTISLEKYSLMQRDSILSGKAIPFKVGKIYPPDIIESDVIILKTVNELDVFLKQGGENINNYDKEFFKNNALIFVAITKYKSSSFMIQEDFLTKNNKEICVGIITLLPPFTYDENGNCTYIATSDVMLHYVLFEVKKTDIQNINQYSYFETQKDRK